MCSRIAGNQQMSFLAQNKTYSPRSCCQCKDTHMRTSLFFPFSFSSPSPPFFPFFPYIPAFFKAQSRLFPLGLYTSFFQIQIRQFTLVLESLGNRDSIRGHNSGERGILSCAASGSGSYFGHCGILPSLSNDRGHSSVGYLRTFRGFFPGTIFHGGW